MPKFPYALDRLSIEQPKRFVNEVEAVQYANPRLTRKEGSRFWLARVGITRVVASRHRKDGLGIASRQRERTHAIKRSTSLHNTESAEQTACRFKPNNVIKCRRYPAGTSSISSECKRDLSGRNRNR